MHVHTWEDPEIHQIWTVNQTNMDCEPDKSKWLPKENPEEMPHKSNSNYLKGMTQQLRNSPSESACVSIYTYCTLFPLINTLLATLLSIFVEFLIYKAEGPGPLSVTTCLVSRIWCFHHCDPVQFLAGNLSPTLSHCRPNPPEIMFMSMGLLLPLIFFWV